MEKLIELIGEWQKEVHPDGIYLPVVAYRDGIFWSDSDCLSSVMDEIHLVSKSCRFIKWLVDNDKIEAHEIRFDNYEGTEFDKVDSTIMLLSIQDNPIEFLCSMLK